MTGLAAGMASGFLVLEASANPGGICSSYYMVPGSNTRHSTRLCGGSYRFELGGGHWIFGGDPMIRTFLQKTVPICEYRRKSSVYFAKTNQFIPYPIQDHLSFLDPQTSDKVNRDIGLATGSGSTMREWLVNTFGRTLCEMFFFPFHEKYTAGLYHEIAPQDLQKSVVPRQQGTTNDNKNRGYNPTYLYPDSGLDVLARRMAEHCHIQYDSCVTSLDVSRREIILANNKRLRYDILISTLPLTSLLTMCGLVTEMRADPYTSVLVLNIGARKGLRYPAEHWLYTPDAVSGFHRVGFYTNVSPSFAPQNAEDGHARVGLYVESAYRAGVRPSPAEQNAYETSVIAELREWGFITDVEVVDATWIDIAYTWSWPGSQWRKTALALLQGHGIYPVGRYGRWAFQGIAESIKEGFFNGAAARLMSSSLNHDDCDSLAGS